MTIESTSFEKCEQLEKKEEFDRKRMDNEFTKAAIQLRNGKFAFGSADGFVIFNPVDLKGTDKLAKVTITDMYLDYEAITKEIKSEKISGNICVLEK